MTELLVFVSLVVLAAGIKICLFPQAGRRQGQSGGGASYAPSPYTRYVHAVQAETNRIFAFAQQVCANREARRILDEQVNVTGQIDADVRTFGRLPDPMLTCIIVQDFVMCYRRLGNRVVAGPLTWERVSLGIVFSQFFTTLKEAGLSSDVWADPRLARDLLPSYDGLIANFSQMCQVEGREDDLMFEIVFGRPEAMPDLARQYAVLLCRWATLLAKADGVVTEQEKKWLAELVRLGVERRAVGVRSTEAPEAGTDPLKELDELVGLAPVKRQVRDLANFVRIRAERERRGMKAASASYHCVFTGNPGTGKTTVARILAGVYKELGVLAKGHLVETDRSGLVAEYVGQTAVKTNKIIDSALEWVLFIDEAYTLVKGGKEPGLRSRFTRTIEFPDYTAEELEVIFLHLAERNQYMLTTNAMRALRARLAREIAAKDRTFGNGRFARNLFERAIERQATRLADAVELSGEVLEQISEADMS